TTTPTDINKKILEQFMVQKEALAVSINLSEIVTDRLMAGLEIITPKLITDIISVNIIDTRVAFELPPMFNKDTAGFAIIKAGASEVDMVFEDPYIAQPVVNTSISFEESDNMTDQNIKDFFDENIKVL
ncbi:MAG: hypothetical protein V4664_03755, partial [Patescibacteria group bacterium]